MEKKQTINEYIAAEMDEKIVRRHNSPLSVLILLAIGAGLLILLFKADLSDSMQTATLTVCAITTAMGILLTAMTLSGALWHYLYVPTHSRMKDKMVYLSVNDYQHCVDILGSGNLAALATVMPTVSSNGAVHILKSHDGAVALLQAGRYDTGHFDPETGVVVLLGTEVAAIQQLCK